jgi:hypothetical protein
MSHPVLRFIHASDFHLERPPYGVAELPEHLHDVFVEAPYWGAERVFEAAIAEQVDFVLLAGDLVDADAAGPRGPLFLQGQFERLRERGIAVYWSAGGVDQPERWPHGIKLPDNVHYFAQSHVEQVTHLRHGQPVAEVFGTRRPANGRISGEAFVVPRSGAYHIALIHANATGENWCNRGIDYWALGGRHRRQTLLTSPCHVHYPGTPQGRSPHDTGSRGATLVEVDAERAVRTRTVGTEILHWRQETVELTNCHSRAALETLLCDRMRQLLADAGGTDLLVRWTLIAGRDAPVWGPRATYDLVRLLRERYGRGTPVAWTVDIELQLSNRMLQVDPQQEAVLADLLDSVEQLERDSTATLGLDEYLAERQTGVALGQLMHPADEAARRRLLQGVDALAVQLLCPEEAQS